MLFTKSGWRFPKPLPVQLLLEPMQWVNTARCLRVILDSRPTVQQESCPKTGSALLSPTQEKRSLHQERNSALLAAHRLMMDYECPVWRSASWSHDRKLQVIQFKCLRIANGAPWYNSNVQIHEDLGVPFFAEHISALTEGFDSKLVGVGNRLVQQLGRYLR
jgi:hypothetical protein